MIIDFHTHSLASDGALDPKELVARARDAGVRQFAITDHDTTAGWQSLKSSEYEGITLVPGVELSCIWGNATIHVIALGFESNRDSIQELLAKLALARQARAKTIAERLARHGMDGALEGAMAVAGEGQLCRPHFAKWMVESGFVESMTAAFDRYLGTGKLGDVKTHWPTLEEVLLAIKASHGVSVLAHPLHYKLTRTKLRALCSAFVGVGGEAIEVINGRQSDSDIGYLCQLARDFECHVSAGSDFHREWRYGADVGIDVGTLNDVQGVWEQFV